MSSPPPDQTYDLPTPVFASNVLLHIVGYLHDEEDCEILASSEGTFYRFYLPKSSRVIRKFWQSIGVTNVMKLPEGAYESKTGLGLFSLTGIAIGEDVPLPEEAEEGVVTQGAKVLIGVTMTEV